MEILEVTSEEYSKVISQPYHVFGSADFNALNKEKCDRVHYLLFRDGKYRLGFIAGTRDYMLLSPYSAPFGGFSFISSDIKLKYVEDAIELLKTWAGDNQFDTISITLPPSIYHSSFISKQINCLWRKNFEISQIDLSNSINLDNFNESYIENIWYNARKNLNISLKSELNFRTCTEKEEKKLAYGIIAKNRETRGFPLRMTWEQVSDTIRIIQSDFFIAEDKTGYAVAAAIVFHVSSRVAQVIYWGDLPEFAHLRTMNFLSYKVFEFYKKAGIQFLDIGPSTENSLPNYGLFEFKESIGCQADPKFTFKFTTR